MLKEFSRSFLDILYPKNCHLCLKVLTRETCAFDDYLCADCVSFMKKTVDVCEPNNLSHISSKGKSHPYQKLFSCYIYEGTTRELVHKFKYGNRPYLYKSIIRLMTETLSPELFNDIDGLIPIPLHRVRQREREFNQAQLLARGLAGVFKKPVLTNLIRIKNTKPQSSLSKSEKISNLKNSFCVTDLLSVKNKNLLLIDDVVTTCSTVNEASCILKNAGARNISVLAFAKG